MPRVFRNIGETVGGNYARREFQERGELRSKVNAKLGVLCPSCLFCVPFVDFTCHHTAVELSADPKATMRWTVKQFRKKIFMRYGLTLVGWPYEMFVNLSKITGLAKIKHLAFLWDTGVLHFERMSDLLAHSQRTGEPIPPTILDFKDTPRQQREDVKRRRWRPKTNPLNLPYRYERNGPKSARWVSAEAEAEAEADDPIEQFDELPSRGPVQRYEFFPRACRDREHTCRGIELKDDPIEQFVD